MGRGSTVKDAPSDRQPRGGADVQKRGEGQDGLPRVPLAPGNGPPAPGREPRGRAAPGERRVEDREAHRPPRRQRPPGQEPQHLPVAPVIEPPPHPALSPATGERDHKRELLFSSFSPNGGGGRVRGNSCSRKLSSLSGTRGHGRCTPRASRTGASGRSCSGAPRASW